MPLDLESLQSLLGLGLIPKAKTGALLSALHETACSLLTFSTFSNNYPEETRPVSLGRAATAGTYQCLWNSKWKPIRWKWLMTFVPAISFTEHVLQWCPLRLETPQKIWLWTTVPKTTQTTPPKTKFYTGRTELQNATISDQLYGLCSSVCKDGEYNVFLLPEQTTLQDAVVRIIWMLNTKSYIQPPVIPPVSTMPPGGQMEICE